MLTLNGVSLTLPDGRRLLDNITFTLNEYDKAALVGNNGVGKSSLFKIIAHELAFEGSVQAHVPAYYIPQLYGQFGHYTVGQALRVDEKLGAMQRILNGLATERDFLEFGDDWMLEDRIAQALAYWQLEGIHFDTRLGVLSGGQRTKAFLAGLQIHQPKLVLLDEPTNHLDLDTRKLLYDFVAKSSATMLITSHDRSLLQVLNAFYELSRKGLAYYSGDYQFYTRQRQLEIESLTDEVKNKAKTLRKAKDKERETLQRQQKLDSRGKGKQEKAGLPKILQNALKNSAERSTAKIKDVHANKIGGITDELNVLREALPDTGKMKLDIDHSDLNVGKLLVEAHGVNACYDGFNWIEDLSFQLLVGERIHINGKNGSGKTTLIKTLLGVLTPGLGTVRRVSFKALYVDQEYSLIEGSRTVAQQANYFNEQGLEEHEINIRLNRFLFPKDTWIKHCGSLSGGEKMRLTLCCLSIGQTSPDMIILDEPTNNLDLQSVDILISAINEYRGTLIVISHDEHFLRAVHIGRTITLRT